MFARDWKAREELILILRRDNADLQIAYNTLEKVLLEKEKALKAEDDKRDTMRILKKDSADHRKAHEKLEKALQEKCDEIVDLRESRKREINGLSEENNALQKEIRALIYKQKRMQCKLMEVSEEKADLRTAYLKEIENIRGNLAELTSNSHAAQRDLEIKESSLTKKNDMYNELKILYDEMSKEVKFTRFVIIFIHHHRMSFQLRIVRGFQAFLYNKHRVQFNELMMKNTFEKIRSIFLKRYNDIINKWKTITSKVSYDHAGMPDKNGFRRVLSKVEVIPPGHVCTETYLVASAFDTKDEAENLAGYMKTKFFRFLVSLLSVTQNITKEKFAFVPQLPMTEAWDDAKLYARYGLTLAESTYIESVIKEMA